MMYGTGGGGKRGRDNGSGGGPWKPKPPAKIDTADVLSENGVIWLLILAFCNSKCVGSLPKGEAAIRNWFKGIRDVKPRLEHENFNAIASGFVNVLREINNLSPSLWEQLMDRLVAHFNNEGAGSGPQAGSGSQPSFGVRVRPGATATR